MLVARDRGARVGRGRFCQFTHALLLGWRLGRSLSGRSATPDLPIGSARAEVGSDGPYALAVRSRRTRKVSVTSSMINAITSTIETNVCIQHPGEHRAWAVATVIPQFPTVFSGRVIFWMILLALTIGLGPFRRIRGLPLHPTRPPHTPKSRRGRFGRFSPDIPPIAWRQWPRCARPWRQMDAPIRPTPRAR